MSFFSAVRRLRSTAKESRERFGSTADMLQFYSGPLRRRLIRDLRDHNQRQNSEEHASAAVRLNSMPTRLHLQTTAKCNFRCIMCIREQTASGNSRASACMDSSVLRRVAREGFAYATSVDLSCSGEPLLATNLDESLQLARLYDTPLNINTNGSLLGRPGMLEKLVPCLGHLTLSLDAATPETLDSIRPGARFHEIVAAVARYNELRNARPPRCRRPTLAINGVLMRRNIAELPDLIRLARRLEVDILYGSHVVVHSPSFKDESLLNDPELFNRYRQESLSVAESLHQVVVLPPAMATTTGAEVQDAKSVTAEDADAAEQRHPGPTECASRGPIHCEFSHQSLFIQTNGDAFPCCNSDPAMPVMGNVARQSIREIWNCDAYLELREGLRTGNLTAYCRRCYVIAEQTKVPARGLIKGKASSDNYLPY